MKLLECTHHTICPQLLRPQAVVLDLGANVGKFSAEMADRFGCKVYAVEASPLTFTRIPYHPKVKTFNFAVVGTTQLVELNISSNSQATSLYQLDEWEYVDTVTVPGYRLDEFIADHNIPQIELLKVDIEGAEIEVIGSCSDEFLESIDQITIEFHEAFGISSVDEVQEVVRRFQKLGFHAFKMNRKDYSDVIFIHRRRMSSINRSITWLENWVPRLLSFTKRKILR